MDNDWKLLTLLIGGNDLCDRWVMWADTKYVHNQYFHSVIWWIVSGKIALTLTSFPGSESHPQEHAWEHGYNVDTKWLYVLDGGSCSCCQSSGLTASQYETHLIRALEEIRQNIPRVFVNLVPMANLSQVIVLTWSAAIYAPNGKQSMTCCLFLLPFIDLIQAHSAVRALFRHP